MSTYRTTWECCDDTTETEGWVPCECPFCEVHRLRDAVADLESDAASDSEAYAHLQDEAEQCRDLLNILLDGIEHWEEPTAGPGRDWSETFSEYLRGHVLVRSAFEPEDWAKIKAALDARKEDES